MRENKIAFVASLERGLYHELTLSPEVLSQIADLPKGISLAVGDEISLPGIESNIVGSVEKIVESNTETFSHIFFKSKVNIYQLSKVFIIIEE